MASMEYRPVNPEDYEAVRQFLSEMGWQERVADPERFKMMMEKTDRTVAAFDASRVVGFARALCDGVSNGYLSMVAVSPDRRGQGIGRELVTRLIGEDHGVTWVLRAGRGSEGFWEKMGFKASRVAMERVRRPPTD
jgi:predicted N-acetyltransferase YhbS